MFKGHPEQAAEISMHATDYPCLITVPRAI